MPKTSGWNHYRIIDKDVEHVAVFFSPVNIDELVWQTAKLIQTIHCIAGCRTIGGTVYILVHDLDGGEEGKHQVRRISQVVTEHMQSYLEAAKKAGVVVMSVIMIMSVPFRMPHNSVLHSLLLF